MVLVGLFRQPWFGCMVMNIKTLQERRFNFDEDKNPWSGCMVLLGLLRKPWFGCMVTDFKTLEERRLQIQGF